MTDDQLQFIPRVQRPSDATSYIGNIGEIIICTGKLGKVFEVRKLFRLLSIKIRMASSGGETQKVQVGIFFKF